MRGEEPLGVAEEVGKQFQEKLTLVRVVAADILGAAVALELLEYVLLDTR